jgi:Arc/MetJ-type ribon-helix-helix transcriptional regulator
MNVHVTDDLKQFVLEAVRSGQYASEDDVVHDALFRLRQTLEPAAGRPDSEADGGRPAKPLTKQEFQRHLVNIGLLDELPSSNVAPENADIELVDLEGEIVSEVVIRERLIEWLTGFLEK